MKDKKGMILKLLNKEDNLATGKIANLIKANQWATLKYLEELERDKKVKRIQETNSTRWKIK